MSTADPIDLLFNGMAKLGPGDDEHTSLVLRQLPEPGRRLIVDAGCGTGRQTLVLARELRAAVHALDVHEPFLETLEQRAVAEGLQSLIKTQVLDMQRIPDIFSDIDLLWSEGAAYNVGFANALNSWFPAVTPGGFVVVSELAWLRPDASDRVKSFFATAYPAMRQSQENLAIAVDAGYRALGTHVLPPEAWVEGYYDVLESRALALLDHGDEDVRAFAEATLEEIEVFRVSDASYGYVFYMLQRP
jgi:SAM-dependent methyltransferase